MSSSACRRNEQSWFTRVLPLLSRLAQPSVCLPPPMSEKSELAMSGEASAPSSRSSPAETFIASWTVWTVESDRNGIVLTTVLPFSWSTIFAGLSVPCAARLAMCPSSCPLAALPPPSARSTRTSPAIPSGNSRFTLTLPFPSLQRFQGAMPRPEPRNIAMNFTRLSFAQPRSGLISAPPPSFPQASTAKGRPEAALPQLARPLRARVRWTLRSGQVHVFLDRPAKATRVGPDEVRVAVPVGRDPHVIPEEPGLDWVVGNYQVRHRRSRDAGVAHRRRGRGRAVDRRQGDVVAAARLATAVRAVVVADEERLPVWRDGAPRLPLSAPRRRELVRPGPRRPAVRGVRVVHVGIARRRGGGCRPERVAVRAEIPRIREDVEELAGRVDRDRAVRLVLHAVAVRRNALPAGRAACGRNRPDRLDAEVGGDLHRCRPVGLDRAVLLRRALDDHVLVDSNRRRVPVEERHVDRAVGTDDRVRALILVACVRV